MEVDVSLIMTVLTLSTGLIVATDKWLFRSQQRGQVLRLVQFSGMLFPVLAVCWSIRSFWMEPYKVPSDSMLPEVRPGDYIAVNKWVYGLRLPVIGVDLIPIGHPQRGDVVVFRYPPHPSTVYIKRVIGLPGDSLQYDHGRLYINGRLVPEQLTASSNGHDFQERLDNRVYVIHQDTGLAAGARWSAKLADEQYFVMGDNRDRSKDSRFWGPVPAANLVGKASYILMHKEGGRPTFNGRSVL